MPNTTCCNTQTNDDLPAIIVDAGPVGLAAAAHLIERDITPVVLEAGFSVGSSWTAPDSEAFLPSARAGRGLRTLCREYLVGLS